MIRDAELRDPGHAEMVAQHYGRFLPEDKAEIAARVSDQGWQAA